VGESVAYARPRHHTAYPPPTCCSGQRPSGESRSAVWRSDRPRIAQQAALVVAIKDREWNGDHRRVPALMSAPVVEQIWRRHTDSTSRRRHGVAPSCARRSRRPRARSASPPPPPAVPRGRVQACSRYSDDFVHVLPVAISLLSCLILPNSAAPYSVLWVHSGEGRTEHRHAG